VDGRRRHHVAAVAAQVDTRGKSHPVVQHLAGMCEVEMATAPAGPSLDGLGDCPMLALQLLETRIRAVARIQVQHHEPGDDPDDDGDVGVGPASEPLGDLRRIRVPVPVDLPADQRVLVGPGVGFDCAVIDLGE
jgi:hypothetical protein